MIKKIGTHDWVFQDSIVEFTHSPQMVNVTIIFREHEGISLKKLNLVLKIISIGIGWLSNALVAIAHSEAMTKEEIAIISPICYGGIIGEGLVPFLRIPVSDSITGKTSKVRNFVLYSSLQVGLYTLVKVIN